MMKMMMRGSNEWLFQFRGRISVFFVIVSLSLVCTLIGELGLGVMLFFVIMCLLFRFFCSIFTLFLLLLLG